LRRISDKGGWREPTVPRAAHRASNDTSKLHTPPHRTLPASVSRCIASHESSTAVPVSSGQWNW